ncbi:MAG: hypothetical protein RL322_1037 [Pseudomonadota bacterium]
MLLLSWNVQWCRGMDGRVDIERVVRTAQHLGDPDVLCFQEVASGFDQLPGSSGEDQFALISELLPGWTCIEGLAVDRAGPTRRKRFGNLICSRLPVRAAWRHSLPWPPDPAHPSMQRVAIETVIAGREHTLRVITCHLEYYSSTQRAAQVERLRELQHEACGHDRTRRHPGKIDGPFEHQPRPDAAVLCGDFNFLPHSADYRQLQTPNASGTRWHDAWPLCHGPAPHSLTNRLHDRSARKQADTRDFFFVSDALTGRVKALSVDAETQASDHQPVMLELAL